jgi:fatty-acyl-CoA synthase
MESFIKQLRNYASDTDEGLPRSKPEDSALIIYTSGTTGKPKGVLLPHQGIVNNALLGSSRYEIAEGRVWLNTLPLFHVGGAVTATLGCLATKGTHVVLPAFEPGLVLRIIEQERVNWLPVVPTMVYAMMEHDDFKRADLSSLEFVLTGGTSVPPELVKTIKREIGVDVQVMFGQTESGGAISKTYRSDSLERVATTVGAAYPRTTIKIQDSDTETIQSMGAVGEIRVRSPYMMTGYFDNVEATAQAFDAEGFLRTGDLGTLDADGYLSIRGRLKDMILRGGENIYAREVEDALCEHEAVSECAVVGVPDPKWGEEVAAFIRLKPGTTVDVAELSSFLADRIARYKTPRIWRFVDDFPRTAVGKIQKFSLAAMLNATNK